jgi:hypothetical protein
VLEHLSYNPPATFINYTVASTLITMFRAAAPGPFDEAISKATDENLVGEDWAAIMEVCDRVTNDAANGSKDVTQSLIKRLAHRNANVQLYTLEVSRDSALLHCSVLDAP